MHFEPVEQAGTSQGLLVEGCFVYPEYANLFIHGEQ
jgi:hypothetical protein